VVLRTKNNVATYASAANTRYFGWPDAAKDSPKELAEKFIERFPNIAADGQGEDAAYAHWYQDMLLVTKPYGLVYAFADFSIPEDRLGVINCSTEVIVPRPSPGEATWPATDT
jgi:hypothetical protein